MPPADSAAETTGEAIRPDDVRRLAQTARLVLTDEEAEQYAGDLNRFLDRVRTLDDVDTEGVAPLPPGAPAAPQHLRPDKPARPLSQQEALENAADAADGLFGLPGSGEESSEAGRPDER